MFNFQVSNGRISRKFLVELPFKKFTEFFFFLPRGSLSFFHFFFSKRTALRLEVWCTLFFEVHFTVTAQCVVLLTCSLLLSRSFSPFLCRSQLLNNKKTSFMIVLFFFWLSQMRCLNVCCYERIVQERVYMCVLFGCFRLLNKKNCYLDAFPYPHLHFAKNKKLDVVMFTWKAIYHFCFCFLLFMFLFSLFMFLFSIYVSVFAIYVSVFTIYVSVFYLCFCFLY